MKFSKMSQLVLVSALGLSLATLMSGCMIVTVDYVFVTSSTSSTAGSPGQIETYAADSQTGALRPVGTPVPSGGSGPVAMASTSDYANLYVANKGNNSIAHFLVNNDGSLTAKESVTVPFTPASVAVNLANTQLYVAGGTNPAEVAVYSLSSGTIGSMASSVTLSLPGFTSDALSATGVTVLNNGNGVYVTAYDQSAYNPGCTACVTSTANPGWVFGFVPAANGSLTPTAGSPYQAGVKPTAVTADPTNRFVYVTDFASNDLIGYSIGANSDLNFLVAGPFKTGTEPTALVIDPRGLYIYVSDSLSSSISPYTIALPTGTPSGILNPSGGASTTTDTDPVAIVVEPALGRFVYTANYLGNSISGFRLDPNTGAVSYTQATPYPTGLNPTALLAVPHGNHAVQSVTP